MSLLAPEYILAKALSELLAAHDSRRQFTEWRKAQKLPKQSDQKDWTTTHGYFANMGGFILRFDVEAVKIPLEPRKPDEFERSLPNVIRTRILLTCHKASWMLKLKN